MWRPFATSGKLDIVSIRIEQTMGYDVCISQLSAIMERCVLWKAASVRGRAATCKCEGSSAREVYIKNLIV